MNEKTTKTDLDAEFERSGTDWSRLKTLSDADIDRAIAADQDAYSTSDVQSVGREGASYRYEIFRDTEEKWRWRLRAADGTVLALSAASFATRAVATQALSDLRNALLGAEAEAA